MFTFHTVVTKTLSDEKIKPWQRCSFHGVGNRCELPGGWQPCFIGSEPVPDLEITRDGNRIPDVCDPDGNLVISSKVRDAIATVPRIEFKPVQFRKLVDFLILPGKESPTKSTDLAGYLRGLPQVAKFVNQHGSYFELVVPRHMDVVKEFPDVTTMTLRPHEYIGDKEDVFQCSESLFAASPIHWFNRRFVFSDDVFAAVEPYLDLYYFECQHYVVT